MDVRKRIQNHLHKLKHLMDRNIIISMGENCLADDILSRYDLKSFSSPFSSGRSNAEYILDFEKEDYVDFLNPDYLKYGSFNEKKVARNIKYVATQNHYHDSCSHGMEFTHHDVISDPSLKETIARRYERLQKLSKRHIVFLYHNRYCEKTDLGLLVSCFEEIKHIYEKRKNVVQIFIFAQRLVATKEERRVECKELNGMRIYTFYTNNIWEGADNEIFFARCDDDLIRVMVDDIRHYVKKNRFFVGAQ